MSSPSFAQTGYYNADQKPATADADADKAVPAAHNFVVTSIGKCYAQLGHDETMDIERHFDKPYQECQRRLALKIKQQHEVKPGQQQKSVSATSPIGAPQQLPPDPTQPPASATAPLSDEGLYYRVQKNSLTPPPSEDDTTPPAAPYGVAPAAPVYKYNR